MNPADALKFLRFKYALILDNTWSEANEKALRDHWEPIFAGLDPNSKMAELQKLDRALEKSFEKFIFDEEQHELRNGLVDAFGLSRITNDEIEHAAVPPLSPDDVLLTPSGKQCPVKRRYQVEGVERAIVDISAKTVGAFAQIYADYSGKDVRLSAALAQREISPGMVYPGMDEADSLEVAAALKYHFEHIHVALLTDGSGMYFKDTSARDAALAEASEPRKATEHDIQRAAAAMSVDRFWELVEATRASDDCMVITGALETNLKRLSADKILGFELRLQECLAASYRLDLWAVAYIVNGGCSDDGFEYFRGWLIAQGREYFEAAMADPERAADKAEVGGMTECEAILYVARGAFARRSKKPMPHGLTPHSPRPIGVDWTEEDLPKLFPRLIQKFEGMTGGGSEL